MVHRAMMHTRGINVEPARIQFGTSSEPILIYLANVRITAPDDTLCCLAHT